MSVAIEEILKLDVKERLELIEEIWDSIAAHPDAIPLTAAQRKELDRRKREHRRDLRKRSPGLKYITDSKNETSEIAPNARG